MLIDEYYCHQKRKLPRWERIGHPIDTLSVLVCIVICIVTQPTPNNLQWFAAAAIFSSLLITKDEFVHKIECTAFESWLHSLLFVAHPTALIAAAYLWTEGTHEVFFKTQFFLLLSFTFYQIFTGIFIKRNSHEDQQRAL